MPDEEIEYSAYSMPPEGYCAWHKWAEDQGTQGIVQFQCQRCKKFLFPQEVMDHSKGSCKNWEIKFMYAFEYDGERNDSVYKTKKSAELAADAWWDDLCENNGNSYSNGETVEDECFIVELFEDDDGEYEEVKRHEFQLEYTHYHGDDAEHNVRWNQ